jgi:hypothetical protein
MVISFNTIEKYYWNVWLILQVIYKATIYLFSKKSNLYTGKTEFLMHVMLLRDLEIMLSTVDEVLGWPAPWNVRNLKAFNGLINCIIEFIPHLTTDYSFLLSVLT